VLVLGAAYKPDIDDIRESPALDVIGLLRQRGADVQYHDPYIPHLRHEHDGWEMSSVSDLPAAVARADAVVIVTDHHSYDYAAIIASAAFVFDCRNATGEAGRQAANVERL
jgi:UDP-N-acetyl-D-glucosamine dehydrogenase